MWAKTPETIKRSTQHNPGGGGRKQEGIARPKTTSQKAAKIQRKNARKNFAHSWTKKGYKGAARRKGKEAEKTLSESLIGRSN